jgi:hypothetical protein
VYRTELEQPLIDYSSTMPTINNPPDTFSEWIESEGLEDSFRPNALELEFYTLETFDERTEGSNFTIFSDPRGDGDDEDEWDEGNEYQSDEGNEDQSDEGDEDQSDEGDEDQSDEGDEFEFDEGEILYRLMNTPAHLRTPEQLQWLETSVQRALAYAADLRAREGELISTNRLQSHHDSDDDTVEDINDT